jgi:hypothetical protein
MRERCSVNAVYIVAYLLSSPEAGPAVACCDYDLLTIANQQLRLDVALTFLATIALAPGPRPRAIRQAAAGTAVHNPNWPDRAPAIAPLAHPRGLLRGRMISSAPSKPLHISFRRQVLRKTDRCAGGSLP